METLKEVIKQINGRNKRVEADKAWETSKTRRLIISSFTYFIIVLFLWLINAPNPWLNSLVPTGAFILSTLTLPFFRKAWLKRYAK